MFVFGQEGNVWRAQSKTLCVRTNQPQLNPVILPGPGLEPGPQWHRVSTGPGKPGKSWNLIMALVLEKGHWSWKGVEICETH